MITTPECASIKVKVKLRAFRVDDTGVHTDSGGLNCEKTCRKINKILYILIVTHTKKPIYVYHSNTIEVHLI